MSRVIFLGFEPTLHGYSIVFHGGITEGAESHLLVALDQGIMLFQHCNKGFPGLPLLLAISWIVWLTAQPVDFRKLQYKIK